MDTDRWHRVDQLLQSALDIPAAERDAFLRSACGDDRRLEEDVRSLLAAHDRADRFLGAPAIDLGARELAGARTSDGSPAFATATAGRQAGPSTSLRAGPSTSLRAGDDPLIGQTLSHYRIVEKLGGGGPAFARECVDGELRRGLAVAKGARCT
jgi:serine/threonine-protein kinase